VKNQDFSQVRMEIIMKYTILAADDEVELLNVLELYLQRENINLIKAKDGIEAMEMFKTQEIHIVLLDIMMPGLNGYRVLSKIRETSKIPAIMLTARDEDYDKILGLDLGADDYITKPYNPLEVVARIKAQLRRNYAYIESPEEKFAIIKLFDMEIRMDEGRLIKNGITINLTSTELKILHLLMKHPGRIFTKRQIFEHVWEEPYAWDDNTIMVHISNLRNKIEYNPRQPQLIKTIKGLGYKMEKGEESLINLSL
jgi:DNA-binding response OmpR family regulator